MNTTTLEFRLDDLDIPSRISSSRVLLASAVTLAAIYYFILYPIFLSPISKLPSAHPLAAVTSLWIQWHRLRGTDLDIITNAFAQKGDYVRIGPSEIGMNTLDGVVSVYGIGNRNFDKPTYYNYFITHGHRNMFSSLGKDHDFRRRRLKAVYAKSFLQTSSHVREIMRVVLLQRLLPLFASTAQSKKGSIDILPILQAYALDYLSAFMFGLPCAFNFIEDTKARQHWFDLYNHGYPQKNMFWLLEQPILGNLLSAIGVPLFHPRRWEAKKELDDWATAKVEESEARLQESLKSGIPPAQGDFPILYESIRSYMAKDAGLGKTFVPDVNHKLELASECFDHLAATRDTFGTAFTYTIYELSRRPAIQNHLREELLSMSSPFKLSGEGLPDDGLPSATALERLPFLNGVIKEGLRLRNTVPNMDPRLTPAKQKSSVGPLTDLPPGIRIGAYAWLIHHRDDLYADAATWNPYRWVEKNSRGDADKRNFLFAFGGGSRTCIGQHTAMELLRFAVAGIYTNFRTSIDDESDYPGANGFVGNECTEQLWVRFETI